MQYDQVHSFLIQKLENGLPAYLTYHDAGHTKNVIEAAGHLAIAENISGNDLVLLKTAALFHDAGYMQVYKGHEEISCNMAKKHLPDYGYSTDQIETICRLILATRWPSKPSDLLEKILCDADMYYLGTEHYSFYADKLYQELKKIGAVKTNVDWLLRQVEFLNEHKYHTKTALRERETQKQKILHNLKLELESSFSASDKMKPTEIFQDVLLILIGVIFAGYALKGFLVPNHFFDGGITGISLLVHDLYDFNLAIVIILLNLPFVMVSFFTISHRFALWTLISVVLLGVCLTLLPSVALTNDKLLISIFGGVFLGIGVGLIMRAGAALDGIEVLALYTLKRTSFTITEIIMGINILIFSVAAFKFGIETALYSVLTYFSATRCIDYVVEGIQAYTGVTIISGKSEMIKYQLVNDLGRGITVYKGERGFLPGKFEISADCDIIFTVITRLELRKLKNLVYNLDPNAFVFANTIREASGGVINRRHHH
ncbi:MAG: YitT family protein [Bacteroidia bacterium]|nr:YitT family protein [Bacteroidia bacterium]